MFGFQPMGFGGGFAPQGFGGMYGPLPMMNMQFSPQGPQGFGGGFQGGFGGGFAPPPQFQPNFGGGFGGGGMGPQQPAFGGGQRQPMFGGGGFGGPRGMPPFNPGLALRRSSQELNYDDSPVISRRNEPPRSASFVEENAPMPQLGGLLGFVGGMPSNMGPQRPQNKAMVEAASQQMQDIPFDMRYRGGPMTPEQEAFGAQREQDMLRMMQMAGLNPGVSQAAYRRRDVNGA